MRLCRLNSLLCGFKLFISGLTIAITCLVMPSVLAQYSSLVIDEALLKEVMPEADSFSEKSGNPPVYRAYKSVEGSAEPSVIGYLFVTPDLPPEEIGYAAPIEVLVGMDIEGTITGMKIIFYRESYRSIRGDFLATERFPDQFKDKNISEGFRVGRDVDGVSRATISSWAVARGIRSSGRRVARAYMKDSDFVVNSGGGAVGLRYLAEQSWEQMLESGLVETLDIVQDDLTELKLTFIYMGNDGMGEQLVGIEDYSRAEREASRRGRGGNMVIVGVDGNASMPFRQERLAVQQGESIFPIRRDRFVYVGSAEAGKITGKFRFAGAIVLDRQIDITQEFKILYDTGNTVASYEGATYKVPPVPLALVQGTPLPAELLANDSDGYDDDGVYGKLINSAPWGEVAALLLLLTLVMISFLRKSSALRWVTLACTLIYLGFINGTFLSISHVTNGIKLGPSLFLRDLPLLIIVVFTLVTTLFWGRVFCSSLCPFGALQDFITRFVPRRFQKELPQAIHDKAIYIKYAVLALLIVTTLSYSEISIFQYFEPFGTLFYQSQSILLWGILIAFLLASTVVSRFYCRYACPLGATLGVIALISPWRIKRVTQCQVCKVCEGACPTGAIRGPDIDFKECVRCDICEIKLINKAGVCRHSVEKVAARHKSWTPVTVT